MRKNQLAWRGPLAKGAILCAAILFSFGLWNSAAWPQAPQAISKDPAIERGHKQFQQSCGFCHGPDATGARGPDLVRSPLVAHDVKGDKIGEIIRLGRPDKGMPAMPLTDSSLVSTITFRQSGSTRLTTAKTYDAVNRLLLISNAPSADSALTFAYGYNSANQRTVVTKEDSSHWSYAYDSLGQLTSGKRFWSDGTYVAGQEFEYGLDACAVIPDETHPLREDGKELLRQAKFQG